MIIVGGGPGGYTAALYAARAGLDTLVLEKLSAGGQMALTQQIDNYPGFEDSVDGFTLAEKMQAQAERFGARTEYAQVERLDLSAEPKVLETREGTFLGKTVVLATGADPRKLGVDHEEALVGRGVFLDGDWCWDAHPFQVTEETREMVLENISFLLNSFLRCSAYDHVIFCWVLHRREIWEDLLRRLTEPYVLRAVSLVCTPETLRSRLEGDIRAGKRIPDVLDRSLAYLPLYDALDIRHLDVTALTPRETAECIRREGGA